MRETEFIRQNQAAWSELERVLEGSITEPEKLSELFVKTTDDLSYARTFYPNRSVRVYLNQLAQRLFIVLQHRSARSPAHLVHFWRRELPLLLYEYRYSCLLSLLFFAGAFALGMLCAAADSQFSAIILGVDYVEMTHANIASGDPMAVYKQRSPFNMFLGITLNNMYVAALTVAGGILFGIGSLVFLLRNAVLVGTFQYFFVEQGLFQSSFLTIWIHGTLEVSSLILATSAGFIIASGLLFPGTYSRVQAFRQSARAGLKVFLGTLPLFALAALFEGFLTRLTEVSELVRLLFILLNLVAILGYFVWYPIQCYRRGWRLAVLPEAGPDIPSGTPDLPQPAGILLTHVFKRFRQRGSWLWGGALILSLLHCLLLYGLAPSASSSLLPISSGLITVPSTWAALLQYRDALFFIPALLSLHLFGLWWLVRRSSNQFMAPSQAACLALVGLIFLVCWPSEWAGVLLFFCAPFLLLTLMRPPGAALPLVALFKQLGRTVTLWGILLILGFFAFVLLDTAVIEFIYLAANWVIRGDQASLDLWSVWLNGFFTLFLTDLLFLAFLLAFELLYDSLEEIETAQRLRKRVQSIGLQRTIQGIRQEQRGFQTND